VKEFATDGALVRSFYAYGTDFHGGVTVVAADVNGDGVDDLVTGTAHAADHVKVFDGATGDEIASFLAFGGYRGGVTIAADHGRIVVGAGPGGAPNVRVFRLVGGGVQEVASFMAFDAGFTGGVSVGLDETAGRLVVGAGAGGPPQVNVYDSTTFGLVGSFLAFDPGYTGGVWAAAGGGVILAGAGVGGGTHVKEFDGDTLAERASFIAAGDVGADQARVGVAAGAAEPLILLTGIGPGTSPRISAYAADGSLRLTIDAFDAQFVGGIFVG
jgi:hypothetical protein